MTSLTTKNKLSLVVLFFSTILSLLVLVEYNGSKILYLTFSFISFCFLIFQLRKNSIFFDNFMGIFFWLGFWFNFSLKIKLKNIFPNGYRDFKYWFSDGVGSFDFSSTSIDKALTLCILSFAAISLASFIREKFFVYEKNYISNCEEKFYKKNKNLILYFFFLSIVIFSILNFEFQIYQRGNINEYGFFLNYSFTFLFFILLPTLTTMIINYEFHTSKSLIISFLASILESFLNSYSILSRNFLFNPLSNILGLFKLNDEKKKFKNNKIFYFLIIVLIFFIISVVLVTKKRNEFETNNINKNQIELTSQNTNQKNKNLITNSTDSLDKLFRILISRLIGIEGVMAVSSSDKLGFKLFFSAIKEKFIRGENSFYDNFKNEKRTTKECARDNYSKDNCIINSVSLMGIVAFLYYSGSYIFLFFSLLIICLFCSFIEFIGYKASNNIIFCALISQILSYRLLHFGYLPLNSYKLLLSICIIFFLIYLSRKIILKIYD